MPYVNKEKDQAKHHSGRYSPTNDKDEETKEHFYNNLQTWCENKNDNDMTVLTVERQNRIRQQRV